MLDGNSGVGRDNANGVGGRSVVASTRWNEVSKLPLGY